MIKFLIKVALEACSEEEGKFYFGTFVYTLGEYFHNLPNSVYEDEPGKMIEEEVDFENFELLSIGEDFLIIEAWGDWQEPVTFCATFNPTKKVFECSKKLPSYTEQKLPTYSEGGGEDIAFAEYLVKLLEK